MSRIRAFVILVILLFLVVPLAGCFGEPEDDDFIDTELEREGWDVTVEKLDGTTETRHVTSSPHDPDTDADGVQDFAEMNEKTDPRAPDTDGDGLLDGHDVVMDADDDRVEEWKGLGIRWQAVPGGAVSFFGERGNETVGHGGDPLDQDTDDDGVSDGDEVAGYEVVVNGESRTVTTLVRFADSDSDRLDDGVELRLGLDPSDKDTDRDGVIDSADIDPYRDVRLTFTVHDVRTEGNTQRVVLDVFGADTQRYRSGVLEVRDDGLQGAPVTAPLNPPDDTGSILEGRHNVTFLVQAYAVRSDGALAPLDLFSETTGEAALKGRVHAMDGTLLVGDEGPGAAWPDGGFSGAEGSIRLSFAPAD